MPPPTASPDPGSAAVRAGKAGVVAADVTTADAAIEAELATRGAAGDNARDRSIRAFIDANRVGSPGYNFVIAVANKAGP